MSNKYTISQYSLSHVVLDIMHKYLYEAIHEIESDASKRTPNLSCPDLISCKIA